MTLLPSVTVLMPAYNAEKHIAEAIASVLNQTFNDFELVIVNDGSTDSTEEIIRSFTDPRIKLFTQENKGVASALNTGLTYAKASYIARFDADDICYQDRLQTQFNFMESNPLYGIIGSSVDYTDMNGEYLFTFNPPASSNSDIQKLGFHICPFIHSSVFYRKEIVVNNGCYDKNAYNFEDHLLWLNILKGTRACNLIQPLLRVRFNPGSVTIEEKRRGKRFLKIKYSSLKKGYVSEEEGTQLTRIGLKQFNDKVNHVAYHSLLAKKFLWNNYNPKKSRANIRQAMSYNLFDWRCYGLFCLSLLPQKLLRTMYNQLKRGNYAS